MTPFAPHQSELDKLKAHLKGPWRIVERETLEDGSVYPRHVSTEVGEYQICLLESANMAALGYDRTPDEQERDRLIASAPELFEAAQLLAADWLALKDAPFSEGLAKLLPAIAKATGSAA